jgi:hypothetical protein
LSAARSAAALYLWLLAVRGWNQNVDQLSELAVEQVRQIGAGPFYAVHGEGYVTTIE